MVVPIPTVYHVGESPANPIQYQFQDSTGTALDLAGYSAVTFGYMTPTGTKAQTTATIVVSATGHVSVAWAAAMTASAGVWSGAFRLTPGTLESELIVWSVTETPHPA